MFKAIRTSSSRKRAISPHPARTNNYIHDVNYVVTRTGFPKTRFPPSRMRRKITRLPYAIFYESRYAARCRGGVAACIFMYVVHYTMYVCESSACRSNMYILSHVMYTCIAYFTSS